MLAGRLRAVAGAREVRQQVRQRGVPPVRLDQPLHAIAACSFARLAGDHDLIAALIEQLAYCDGSGAHAPNNKPAVRPGTGPPSRARGWRPGRFHKIRSANENGRFPKSSIVFAQGKTQACVTHKYSRSTGATRPRVDYFDSIIRCAYDAARKHPSHRRENGEKRPLWRSSGYKFTRCAP